MNKSSLIIVAASLLILLQGCAGSVKMSSHDREALLSKQEIKAVHVTTGWPTVLTPLGALTSSMTYGMSDDWSAGQKLITKFEIEDASMLVKNAFIENINKKPQASFLNVEDVFYHKDDSVEALKEKYKSGAVLVVKPMFWNILYYPFNWNKYQMLYRAQAELISLDESKILWSGNCSATQDDGDMAPTFAQLTNENSTVLKKWVDNATSQCASQLVNDFMS